MIRRARTALVAVLALVGFLLAGALGARAQVAQVPELPDGTTTTTAATTTTTTTSTTTTTAPGGTADEDEGTTTTTSTTSTTLAPALAPPGKDPAPPPAGGAPDQGGSQESPPAEHVDGEAPTGAGPFPPELKALMNSVKRSGPSNTKALVAALRALEELGVPPEEIVRVGFGRFPVGGVASYVHDWWFPRFGPAWRLHQGTDIFAAAGTPVRAPADGTIRITNGGLGGLSTYVDLDDGGYYYLTHLSAHPPGLTEGMRVRTGDVVGYVGTSGNAAGGAPHLHFEYHPAPTKVVTVGRGKQARKQLVTVPVPKGTVLPAVDPKPYLDFFVAEALANVPKLLAAYEAGRPRAVLATGLTRRFSSGQSLFDAPHRPPRSQLLWASSANPAGGALALARAEAADAARSVDWTAAPAPRPVAAKVPAAAAVPPGRARYR